MSAHIIRHWEQAVQTRQGQTEQPQPTPQPTPGELYPELVASDALIVGAGFAGAVIARELAERGGLKVAVVERRRHIGGNAFDAVDEQGVLIHEYGPHIYHTNAQHVHDWLSRFTQWRTYDHEVLAFIHGSYVPVPFNLNSIEAVFEPERAARLIELLCARYERGARVPIIELRAQDDPLLRELADYVYENVFLHYTVKQWGQRPEEIDPSITARVPVLVDRDNRYFQDCYQGMPLAGYTPLFEQMLDHPTITVYLGLDAADVLGFGEAEAGDGATAPTPGADAPFTGISVLGKDYPGLVIYSGALDELSAYRFGVLPYRTLDLIYKRYHENPVQPCATVNHTVSEPYTRTTEFTWLTGQESAVSTVLEEYSRPFEATPGETPYYPFVGEANQQHYERYRALFSLLPRFYPLGRLAEYRYYNMDQIVLRALELADELC